MNKQYDYLIAGSGLFGATFAHQARLSGKKCLVIDKRQHAGGNIYCREINGINTHAYGPHIFHTSNRAVWDFAGSLVEFNRFTNSPVANYKGRLYNLPFNMNTFYALWGVKTPAEARAKINGQRQAAGIVEPRNLEEQAIYLVGRDIYEILVKEYTEKQWGRKCAELPAFIIRRLPVRFTFDNNYFNDLYQGIPIGGYNRLIDRLLEGIETRLETNFFDNRQYFESIARQIIFTGKIDEYYGYRFGRLEYRTVRFETETLDCDNYQGSAIVNYTSADIPYTRIIEHKHFEFGAQPQTVISREYSSEWTEGSEAFYPVNDAKNNALYQQYLELARRETGVTFGGRLAEYKYYDMDKVIESALHAWQQHA
ncbi:MAG: UDP-galactopyranose mutase [Tannerellaceae bacterium]|jgi:UDP-galactopyranose mutase|nr:UDP-galactopyranose mutase [Tannerellaceae bacterium]